ncbi:hypothetical protein CLV92_1258 [Kineococcus xinjiangensis]|uniref:Uncharacterized protein n=1 Tax=Kineococcus xinjiangensis TaxID=512762 RepID=A0A2S6IBY7_9ACTN|nr:hypothetical protein [Kineococcus xinjiangensis]PPK90212.1 hypothetical protein CLV92_1258 [Kineococcus xinjiangensis]
MQPTITGPMRTLHGVVAVLAAFAFLFFAMGVLICVVSILFIWMAPLVAPWAHGSGALCLHSYTVWRTGMTPSEVEYVNDLADEVQRERDLERMRQRMR